MPGDVTMEVDGLKELEKVLGELGDEATDIGSMSLFVAAKDFQRTLQDVAPRGEDVIPPSRKYDRRKRARLGRLFTSISVGTLARSEMGAHEVVWQVGIGRAYWGLIYEIGDRYQPARPWMRPAFDGAAPQLVTKIEEDLRQRIEKAAAEKARQGSA